MTHSTNGGPPTPSAIEFSDRKEMTSGPLSLVDYDGEYYFLKHNETNQFISARKSDFHQLAMEILRHERQKEIYDFAHKEGWEPNEPEDNPGPMVIRGIIYK